MQTCKRFDENIDRHKSSSWKSILIE